MALVIDLDHINVHFGYQAEGDPELAHTALGFEVASGLEVGEVIVIGQALVDAWQLNFKGVTGIQWRMVGSYMEIGDVNPPYLRVDLAGSTLGEGATLSLPNNSAALIKKSTETAGRSGRGRMFVPGLVSNAAGVNGVLDPTERGLWQDAIEGFATAADLVDGVLGAVVFHDSASPSAGDGAALVTAFSVDTKIATQRTRMR